MATSALTNRIAVIPVPIASGGTGETAETDAFDALSPTTTKGDLIVNNGSDNVRQAVGTDGQAVVADSTQSTGIKFATLPYNDLYTESDASTITFNVANGRYQRVTVGGNRQLAVSNFTAGMKLVLDIVQDGTGGRVPLWWSGIKWAGGIVPVFSTTPGRIDTFGIICVSAGVYQGYSLGSTLF
mgnify:CR=1 FL=1